MEDSSLKDLFPRILLHAHVHAFYILRRFLLILYHIYYAVEKTLEKYSDVQRYLNAQVA